MARYPNLEKRLPSGVYYARLDIPTDLVSHFKKPTLKKSLFTKDAKIAKRLYPPIIEGWQRSFDDVRSRRELTNDDLAHATWAHYSALLERDEQNRRGMPSKADIDEEEDKIWQRIAAGEIKSNDMIGMINAQTEYNLLAGKRERDVNARRRRLKVLQNDLAQSEISKAKIAADQFIDEQRLLIDPKSDGYRDLSRRLMRGEIEALERSLERDTGDYAGGPKDPLVKPAEGVIRAHAVPGESVAELFEAYAHENPRKISVDTLNQARRDVGTLVQLVGRSFPANKLDKKVVREWKALLLRYPVKATEMSAFNGMSMKQIVKENETLKKRVISSRTVNRYLSSLGAFCTWLVSHGC